MDMNEILMLVRVLGESVDTLAKLVEGMPKAMERKLTAHAASVDEKLAGFRKDFVKLETGLTNDSVQLSMKLEAAEVSIGENLNGFRQIIADNQTAAKELITSVNDRLNEFVAKQVQGLELQIRQSAETQGNAIAEVRRACDTTDLHHAVSKLEAVVPTLATVEEVKKADDDLGARLGHTRERLKDDQDKVDNRLETLAQGIEVLTKSIGELDVKNTEAFVRLAARVDEQAQTTALSTDAVDKAVDELRKRTGILEKATGEIEIAVETFSKQADAIEKTVETAEKSIAVVTKVAQDAAAGLSPILDRTFALEEATGRIDAEIKSVVGKIEEVESEIKEDTRQLRRTYTAGVEELRASIAKLVTPEQLDLVARGTAESCLAAERQITELSTALKAVAGDIRAEVKEATTGLITDAQLQAVVAAQDKARAEQAASLEKSVIELEGTLARFKVGTDSRIAAMDQTVVERNAAVLQTLRGEYEVSLNSVREATGKQAEQIAEADKAIKALAETFINLQNFAAETREQVLGVAKDVVAVSGRVDELPKPPEPFDSTAFEVRMLNKVAEMIPEHAALEMPVPELNAFFRDNTLVVSMKMGDKETEVSRDLELGMLYRGVYSPNENYVTGNMVTHKGSMWFAKSKPTGEPGKDITGWQLAVKCGRDGRDATPARAYAGHEQGRLYREADFLRFNNRLWQCSVKETTAVPGPGDITSTREWLLIGGVH